MYKKIREVFIGAVIIPMMFIVGDYLVIKSSPMDLWVKYYNVQPLKQVFEGEDVVFVSDFEKHRVSNLRYEDVLYCRKDMKNDYQYHSVYYSSKTDSLPADRTRKQWVYPSTLLPNYDADCYLRTNVILELSYGLKKVQTLRSNPFTIFPNDQE